MSEPSLFFFSPVPPLRSAPPPADEMPPPLSLPLSLREESRFSGIKVEEEEAAAVRRRGRVDCSLGRGRVGLVGGEGGRDTATPQKEREGRRAHFIPTKVLKRGQRLMWDWVYLQ